MNGIWILLLLIVAAALPVIIVFFWFRAAKSPLTPPWFLASLAAGIISLFISVLIQKNFSPPASRGLGPVFFGIFIRIALVEELSRFVSLIPLFAIGKHRGNLDKSFSAAAGLTSGLGFAMIESAFYGIPDIHITLLRAVTAAPLHGACGIRAGAAFFFAGKYPGKALLLFISAVLIHGAYNLMIVNPFLPSILAIPIAFAAFIISVHHLKTPDNNDEDFFPRMPLKP